MLEDVPHEEVGHKAQGGGSDTVSAVAMDADGHLACAMSTGTCRKYLFQALSL
jgi:isoaspartyl peptidase/L-asparaginase-like protein (Ntn-hydrolase superfamily)